MIAEGRLNEVGYFISPLAHSPELTDPDCDARMNHMKHQATVRELRYHFPEIEARLSKGEEIEVRKRRKVIARLLPVRPKAEAYPDFAALRKEIFGGKRAPQTGTALVSEERGHY
jgi:antitoxin (DNA-binding transcriptional repressor) of toxin-antitoxin stability system